MNFTFKPFGSRILVKQDPPRDATASGLHIPEKALPPPWSGVVLDRGPHAESELQPGQRLLWRSRSGHLIGSEGIGGEERAIRVLDSSQVLALLDPSAPESPSMSDEEWARFVHAPAGWVLVERVEMPISRGRIQLPDSARFHVRSNEVIVRSIGEGASLGWLEVGQRCYLGGAIGDELRFGDRGEVKLWRVPPESLLGEIVGDEAPPLEPEEPEAFLSVSPLPSQGAGDEVYDEGDSRGIR